VLQDEITFLRTEIYLREFEPRLADLDGLHTVLGEDIARISYGPGAAAFACRSSSVAKEP
jgi:hypothetical protein